MMAGWHCEEREALLACAPHRGCSRATGDTNGCSDVEGIEHKATTTTKPDTGLSVIVGFDAASKQHRILSSVTQVVNFYFDGRLDDRKTQVASQLYMQFFF